MGWNDLAVDSLSSRMIHSERVITQSLGGSLRPLVTAPWHADEVAIAWRVSWKPIKMRIFSKKVPPPLS